MLQFTSMSVCPARRSNGWGQIEHMAWRTVLVRPFSPGYRTHLSDADWLNELWTPQHWNAPGSNLRNTTTSTFSFNVALNLRDTENASKNSVLLAVIDEMSEQITCMRNLQSQLNSQGRFKRKTRRWIFLNVCIFSAIWCLQCYNPLHLKIANPWSFLRPYNNAHSVFQLQHSTPAETNKVLFQMQ